MLPRQDMPHGGGAATLPMALGRNAACHQCRKRKRKCDAVRPICTPCRNPLRRKPSVVDCTWDEPSSPSIQTVDEGTLPISAPLLEQSATTVDPDYHDREYRRALLLRRVEGGQADLDRPYIEGQEYPTRKRRRDVLDSEPEVIRAEGTDKEETSGWTDLIWPDWPYDLPSPVALEHIVLVFFDKVPMVPKMLRRQTLLANLSLPPSHSNFPVRSLIHAIIAITAPYLPPSIESIAFYAPIRKSPAGTASFAEYDPAVSALPASVGTNGEYQNFHRRKAMERLAEQCEMFVHLIPGLQTQIIIAQMDLLNAKSIPFWQEAGACVRMAVPLLLNESPHRPDNAFNRFMYLSIPPAQSDMEQAERDRTWWMAWLIDRQVTVPGFWPAVLDDSNVTVELPVSQANFDAGTGELTGCQTLHSEDLFSLHPERHADSFVMLIKAMKLNANITAFFRTYSRGPHSLKAFSSHPTVARLRIQVAEFRQSFPAQLRKPTHGQSLDPELLAAIWLINGADVTLGEPLIPEDWTCNLAQTALAGIRGSLSLLYDVLSTSFEITLLSQLCLSVWFACGRALCRFIEAATLAGDLTAAAVFSQEVQVFRRAISLFGDKMQIGLRQLRRIDSLLEAQQQAVNISHTLAFDAASEVQHPQLKPTLLQITPGSGPSSTFSTPARQGQEANSESAADWGAAWVHSANFSFETPAV